MNQVKFLTSRQIIFRILMIILSAEFSVMMLLDLIALELNIWIAAALDTILLAMISTPAIYIWIIKPLSDSKDRAISEIELLAMTDSLTQLSNRRHFDDILNLEFGRQVRSGREFSLLMLDIDDFKLYNDRYGHPKGDECLKQVASVLEKHSSRTADLAARYGGEEFICIFPETSLKGAMIIAENIRQDVEALNIEHLSSRVGDRVTVSIGVTSSNSMYAISSSRMLEHVDKLLYQAKEAGRNRVVHDEVRHMHHGDHHLAKLV
jgi:two-component system, cell cycle response regulator